MTGIDFRAMTKAEREATINHLLHSPIPFGNIDEVLTPDTRIDLGYTHTLDKNWTRVGDLGDGVWKVWIISNNNNGSHTGHNLGEFKVQLSPGLTSRRSEGRRQRDDRQHEQQQPPESGRSRQRHPLRSHPRDSIP